MMKNIMIKNIEGAVITKIFIFIIIFLIVFFYLYNLNFLTFLSINYNNEEY